MSKRKMLLKCVFVFLSDCQFGSPRKNEHQKSKNHCKDLFFFLWLKISSSFYSLTPGWDSMLSSLKDQTLFPKFSIKKRLVFLATVIHTPTSQVFELSERKEPA